MLLQNIQTLKIRTCDLRYFPNMVLRKLMIFEQTKNPLSHIDLKGLNRFISPQKRMEVMP